jgi:glycosyltransferase involved in cell wall biosynthesis
MIATSPQLFCGLAGAVLKRLRRIPFVLEIRDLWPEAIVALGAMRESPTVRMLERCERWMYAQGDHLVAVGDGYRRGLRDRNVAASRISVITNGIDLSRQQPQPRDEELLAHYGFSGKFVVGVIGTIGMAAGLEVVLEAAEKLRARSDDDIVFLIVGDGAERERLMEMTAERGLSNVVFTGRRSKAEMPSYLASVDACLVHLRDVELFSTVLPSKMFEAAAMARPMILGVRGEAAALLEACGGGVLIEPENAEQLVAVAREWADDPAKAIALGEAGRRYMITRFDLDNLALDYEGVLNQVVEPRRKTGTEGS